MHTKLFTSGLLMPWLRNACYFPLTTRLELFTSSYVMKLRTPWVLNRLNFIFILNEKVLPCLELSARIMSVLERPLVPDRNLRHGHSNQGRHQKHIFESIDIKYLCMFLGAPVQRPNPAPNGGRWPRGGNHDHIGEHYSHSPARGYLSSNSNHSNDTTIVMLKAAQAAYIPPEKTPTTPDEMVRDFLHCMRKLGMDML